MIRLCLTLLVVTLVATSILRAETSSDGSSTIHSTKAESILHFISEASIGADGKLTVSETISIRVSGLEIKHGILRDFPTTHLNRSGVRVGNEFMVLKITRDGAPEKWTSQDQEGSIQIRIGDPEVLLNAGIHTFRITYRTNSQTASVDGLDELYWNVTGNGWVFPIEKAQFLLRLFEDAEIIRHHEYTGAVGESGNDARVLTANGNQYLAETTRTMHPGEGFTVAIAWRRKSAPSVGSEAGELTHEVAEGKSGMEVPLSVEGVGSGKRTDNGSSEKRDSAASEPIESILGHWAASSIGCAKAKTDSEYSGGLIEISRSSIEVGELHFDRDEYPCIISKSEKANSRLSLTLRCDGEEGEMGENVVLNLHNENEFDFVGTGTFVRCDQREDPSFQNNPSSPKADSPRFDEFKTAVRPKPTRTPRANGGKLAKQFRTRINEALKHGPNIGGHFSLVELGCGTQCINYVLADTETGKVGEIVVGSTLGQTVIGVEHRIDSSLLRVKWMDYPSGPCFNTDYVANGLSLKRLKQVQVGVGIDQCFE